MKKILYSLLAFAAGSILFSCQSLNLSPEDYYGSSNFWNNASQVETYALGLHSQMRSQYNMFFVLGEARGGTLRLGNSSQNTSMNYEAPIKTNTFTASSTGISNWFGIYSNLLQVNLFIDQVENACDFLSPAQRGYYLGEAYGIRALFYFMLYRTYGGVPLELTVRVMEGATNASDLYLARSTAEETLAQIKKDIEASETNFGSSTEIKNKYTWSPFATQMLKAQVYLWSAKVSTDDHKAGGTSDFNTAKAALEKVIAGPFSLLDNFADIFSKKVNDEVILSLYFDKTEATNVGGYFVYQPSDLTAFCSATENGPFFTSDPLELVSGNVMRHEYRPPFVRSFDPDDSRRAATFFEYYANGTKPGAAMKKYIGTYYPSENVRAYDSDVIVFRYADAILMMAEVENGLGGDPSKWINAIRERAFGEGYPQYRNASFAENELAILHERDYEFVAEGTRWFDLIRLQDANKESLVFSTDAAYATELGDDVTPVLSKDKKHMLLWPIDVTVLNADELIEQNPGY